ncbi:MAG: hypothetical protein ABIK76_04595 [candidate division WOR-3 bacterium]
MMALFCFLIFLNNIFIKWYPHKDTLYIGEGIVLILKVKSTDSFPQKAFFFPANQYYLENGGLRIKWNNKIYYWHGEEELIYPMPDSIILNPEESAYSIYPLILFWKKFSPKDEDPLSLKEGKMSFYLPLLVFKGFKKDDTTKDYIKKVSNNTEEIKDSFTIYFKIPKIDKEFFNEIINFSGIPLKWDTLKKKIEICKKYNDTIFLPYFLYYSVFYYNEKKEAKSFLEELRKRFQRHIMRELAEVSLAHHLSFLSRKKEANELLKKIKKKYPNNFDIKRIEMEIGK